MIKAIIFDLGGVILVHRKNLMGHILSQMFHVSEHQGEEIWEKNKLGLMNGTGSSKVFLSRLKDKLETEHSISELLKKWDDLYAKNAEINYQMLQLVQTLKTRYKVYLLTDTIDTHDSYNKTRGIYNSFTQTFQSHIEKITKVEGVKVFKRLLKEINYEAQECVFIDDFVDYVKSSKMVGMKGLLFTNIELLKEDLYKLGVQI